VPSAPYALATWKKAKLHPDCHVVFEDAFYSAPHRLTGQRLWVRGADTSVQIFHEHQLVASHSRAIHRGQRLTHPDHLPPAKIAGLLATPASCVRRASDIGPAAARDDAPALRPPRHRLFSIVRRIAMQLNHQLVPKLKNLRLSGILATLEVRTQQAITEKLAYVDFLERLVEDEVERRSQKQLQLRLRRATVDLGKTLEGFDFSFNPSINRQQIFDLATGHFIERHETVLIQGPAGVGKSHLAQALGHEACRRGFDVVFVSVARMLGHLHGGRADGTYERRLLTYTRPDLLILDDLRPETAAAGRARGLLRGDQRAVRTRRADRDLQPRVHRMARALFRVRCSPRRRSTDWRITRTRSSSPATASAPTAAGAATAAARNQTGLWILPALWITPQTGVSHSALENRTERGFPQALTTRC
jgi:DNA replication protein DnaC